MMKKKKNSNTKQRGWVKLVPISIESQKATTTKIAILLENANTKIENR